MNKNKLSHSTSTLFKLPLSKFVCVCTITTLFTCIPVQIMSTCTFTTHALTPIQIRVPLSSITKVAVATFDTRTRLNAAIRRNSDLSGYSIDDLRKIAAKKGYDTTGMDRAGLENIAIGWSTKQTPNFPFDNNMNTGGMRSASVNNSSADPARLPKLQPAVNYVNYVNNGNNGNDGMNNNNNPNQSSGRQEPTVWQRQRMQQQQEQMRQEQMEQQMRQEQNSVRRQEMMRQQQIQQQQMQQQEMMRQQQQQQMQQQPFLPPSKERSQQRAQQRAQQRPPQYDFSSQQNNNNNNFLSIQNMSQPMKAFGIGFFSGFIAVSPITFTHHMFFPAEIITNSESQWLFDTLTGAIAAGAFATVYRFFVKEVKDDNLVSFFF